MNKFPEWLLRRFSSRAKEDFKNNKSMKTFHVKGPIADAAVCSVLGWMEANAKTTDATPFNPKKLSFSQTIKVYHAAKELRIIPQPEELRQRIWDHIEKKPAGGCIFILMCETLTSDKALLALTVTNMVNSYVTGSLDAEDIKKIKYYTARKPEIEREIEKRMEGCVDFQRREIKRGKPVQIVYTEWHLNTEEEGFKASANGECKENLKPEKEVEDTEEQRKARRDSARQGLQELQHDDIAEVLKSHSGNVKFPDEF
jgi:hypothetical protein